MWYSNDTMFHYMFKAVFVTLVSLKVPSGSAFFFPLRLYYYRARLHYTSFFSWSNVIVGKKKKTPNTMSPPGGRPGGAEGGGRPQTHHSWEGQVKKREKTFVCTENNNTTVHTVSQQ